MRYNGREFMLTESELHQLVNESVRVYLNEMDEGFWGNLGAAFSPLGKTAKAGMNQAGQYAANKIGGAYNSVKNAATKAGQAVGNAASQTANAMQQNYKASKLQDMRKNLEDMFIKYANYAGAGQPTINAFNQLMKKIDQRVNMGNSMAKGSTNGMMDAFGIRR